MNAHQEHQVYLRQRGYMPLCCNIFSVEEYAILERFGFWMSALTAGKIAPFTPAQTRFVQVDKGECEAETIFEKVWVKLKERQKYEDSESDSIHYTVFDPAEAWYPRSSWKQNHPDRS